MALNILIPARGGSKRIPKKNLADLNGKPLLYYSINTCRNITENIWVSTDDDDIKEFADSMNVNVIERPERLATDESKTEEKGVETKIAKLEKNKKKNKKEITSLKRKLTISKKKTTKMEKTFESGDSDKAADFLKDFSK